MAWHSTWNNSPDQPPQRGLLADRGGFFPPGVKLILLATIVMYFITKVLAPASGLEGWLDLSLRDVLHLEVWRLVTYMFLHGNFNHILVNMLVFVMLGAYLERQIGTRQFLALYFVCGIAGGLCELAFNGVMYQMYGDAHLDLWGHTFKTMPMVGASAGVAGVLVGFATLNPREKLYVFFILPVAAWWVALVYILYETWPLVVDFVYGPTAVRDNVAHAAHFGGMIVGFLWIKWGYHFAEAMRGLTVTDRPRYVDREPDEEEAEMNRILDKIRDSGIDSLTTGEKMFLQEMTRKRRGE
jgi:membrane associated rhomboid family serine protease